MKLEYYKQYVKDFELNTIKNVVAVIDSKIYCELTNSVKNEYVIYYKFLNKETSRFFDIDYKPNTGTYLVSNWEIYVSNLDLFISELRKMLETQYSEFNYHYQTQDYVYRSFKTLWLKEYRIPNVGLKITISVPPKI